jgi:uncharacterized protein (TIGR02678 family)
MVDPVSLSAALDDPAEADERRALPDSATRFGLMRRLIELPACLIADLNEAERAYLNSQRHRVLAWCTEMTGWVVEQRAEGLALVVSSETDTDLPFPRVRAAHFAALMVLDGLLARQGGDGLLDDGDIDAAAAEVRARYPRAMSRELETGHAVRERSIELLRALDLLRPHPGTSPRWWLSPVAARFRNPPVQSVSVRLDEALA